MRLLQRRITRLILLRRAAVCLLTAGMAILLSGCGQGNTDAQNQPVTEADAVRLLEQASWGPNEASIEEVKQKGLEGYLNEQFVAPLSGMGTYPVTALDPDVTCPPGSTTYSICKRDNYSTFLLQLRFFQNALNGRDQLRQRVAFALSQIFVVSAKVVNESYAIAGYQRLMEQHAFGNFRNILSAVTLSPAMGHYLNMANNAKPDPVNGVAPNENYARELLQLFSIGVYLLNPDGTLQKNSAGRPIPAYDQEMIEGFSHAFTGWTYPARLGAEDRTLNLPYFVGQMSAAADTHDTGAKKLLGGTVLPAHQTPEKDMKDALANIFNHPNVGPFIGKQLIQHLVTSNPSPAYVSRVTGVFNNNGQGVRGDMKAVVRAILLDAEARGDVKTDPQFGKLREPVKFILAILRALDGRSDGVSLRGYSALMGQDVYRAPSVFSFYPTNYPLPGTTLVSPVSAVYTTSAALVRANFVHGLVNNEEGTVPDPTVVGAIGTRINLAPLAALAHDPEKLMDKLDLLMMHKSMSDRMRDIIIEAIDAVPVSDPFTRARIAIYLIATSPQYQVER
jgi:hypothetical protein